jgi:TRAP-type C4-dicarboxylate transport system permease small subunit
MVTSTETHGHRTHMGDNRSIADLLRELRDESVMLFRQEVALAKTEVTHKASRTGRNAAYLAAGGLVAFLGAFFILFGVTALIYMGLVAAGLEHIHAGWLSPLIVGIVVALVGYSLVQKAISTLKHESLVPERTVQSLQEDKQWMQAKVR